MSDLRKLLDQIDRLDQRATKGPWVVDKDNPRGIHDPLVIYPPEDDGGVIAYVQPDQDDAEFIALARTVLPKLAEAVYHVLDLLDVVEKSDEYSYDFGGNKAPSLVTTNEVRRAITDAMGADDD